jgi:hypothetical protein
MELKTLITDTNRKLFDSVSKNKKVQLVKSQDHHWGSNKLSGTIIIEYSDTSHPEASFCHELLHFDAQDRGYRRIRGALSLNAAAHSDLSRLCEMIDNEFQHHKMYPKFVSLGYAPTEFYNDYDSIAEQYIEANLKISGQSLRSLAVTYFTLIAPGGSLSSERFSDLKAQFRTYDNGAFNDSFDKIDQVIESWKSDKSYNAESYIISLLNVLGCVNTWVTYTGDMNTFPTGGFFTDRTFTLADINKVFSGTK